MIDAHKRERVRVCTPTAAAAQKAKTTASKSHQTHILRRPVRRACELVCLGALLPVTFLLTGCNSAERDELRSLRSEVVVLRAKAESLETENTRLSAEILELKQTPANMLAAVQAAAETKDPAKITQALIRMRAKHPRTPELDEAERILANLVAATALEKEEASRITRMGFRALLATRSFTEGAVTFRANSIETGGNWIFDRVGGEYSYVEPERGSTYVRIAASISSKINDPLLPEISVYITQGNALVWVGSFEYRFHSWTDYGSYIGNYVDYRNDFSRTETIRFSLGVSVDSSYFKGPLFVVASREGCHRSTEERFGRPEVSYSSCGTPPSELTVQDFSSGKKILLHVIGANKL